MNRFFDWLKPGLGRTNTLEQKSLSSGLVALHGNGAAAWSMLENGGNIRNGYCRNPVVYRCISMIAQASGSIPLKICEDGVDCDVHDMLQLIAKPNTRQSGKQFLETIYSHLLISGSAYIMRVTVNDKTGELHALSPAAMAVAQEEDGWPIRYRYTTGQGGQRIFDVTEPACELLVLNLFNPMDETGGLSPLSAAHMALDIHNSASSWNKALLDNSARPSGAIVYASSSGDNLTDDQFDRLKSELEEGYTGARRAGRPMVLEGGLDWKAMGYSPRDMDFLEAKNGAAREIALAFGVPPMLLGIPGDNTYSNFREANFAFWTQTVLPLAEKITNRLGDWLSSDFGGAPVLGVANEKLDVLAAQREAQWKRLGEASFLTGNEKREALGYAPLEEFEHDVGE